MRLKSSKYLILLRKELVKYKNMMKGLKELVKSKWDRRIGNHSLEIIGNKRFFYYWGNNVCKVDDENKTFILDDCGYSGYSSTTRTLNDYKRYFSNQGYKETFKND